jgi:anti-sigma regulatory factor (Ser/Thr protein kinase)
VRQLTEARQVAVRLVPGDDREPLVVEAVEDQSAESTEIRSFDVLTVPVLGRDDREVGAVEVWLHPSSALRPQTRALLTPVARVLGALVEEGRHAAREGVVAAALQSALLPEQLPEVEGLELAAAYLPGEQDVQVGGDWYDVLQLPGGKVLVCIGDVEGRGLTSALVMGQIRTAVRAYALEGRGPVEIVRALEELVSRMPDSAFSTLFLGRLDVGTGELVWCSAGHPPPVLVRPGHPPAWLDDVPSLPLGASLGVQPVESTVALPHGATLVAYTDGLVEDRQHQLEVGMPALLETVAAAAGREAGTVLNAALKLSGPERRDDVAVLVLRRADVEDPSPLADGDAELVLPRAPQAAGQARREVRKVLRGAGVSEDATFELLVGLSEAINNAVEHALDPRRDEVVVRVRVEATRRRVRLEVQDFGRWRERRPSMDRGYGASLMSAGCSVQVQPGPDGTLVTLEREV